MTTSTTTQKQTFEALKQDFEYTNIMQTPKIVKVIVSTGVGSVKDKKRRDMILDRITRISGQKPSVRVARKSVASFKVREGDTAGFQVTLRGARMNSFLDKLVHLVFPRVKDFHGINPKTIDEMGNISIGFKDHSVFPETSDEDSRDVFGLAITIVTTAKSKAEAEALLRHAGVPLEKAE